MGPSIQYRAWSLEVIEAGSGRQACMVPMRAPDDWNPYQKGGLAGNQQSDKIPDTPPSLQEKRQGTGSKFHGIGLIAGKKGGL